MLRFLAGAVAAFLMITGAFLMWQGHAQDGPGLPPPPAKSAVPSMIVKKPAAPPAATPKSRETKRFDRADRDNDGIIVLDELLQPRRKSFAKLDKDADGKLSFTEWAHTTIDKFHGADFEPRRAPHPSGICNHRAQAAKEAQVQLLTTRRLPSGYRCRA